MIIHVYIIAIYIYHHYIKKPINFDMILASNNWPILLKEIEEKYLISQKNADVCQRKDNKSITEVTKLLLVYKHKYENNCIDV